MRPDDLFHDDLRGRRRFDGGLARQLRVGPLESTDDVEAAVALARLVHDDLEAFGTGANCHTSTALKRARGRLRPRTRL